MSRRIGIALVLLVALGGCAPLPSATTDAELTARSALRQPPRPQLDSVPDPQVACPNRTASLRPPRALPAPGAMPAGSYMARIQRRGYLRAGVDQNTLLFSYFNPVSGHLEGFEIDLLRNLARAIFGDPSRVEFVAITTDERASAVQEGKVDVVADAMTITCWRLREVAFSSVYFQAGQRILVPTNSRVRGIEDLAGRRVCATAGSTSIQNVERRIPAAILRPVAQRTDCLVELQQGRVDAISSDDAILRGLEVQDPYTKIVGRRFSAEPYGIAISRAHPGFVRFVNGVLAHMRADGRWRAIYKRWLGRFGPVPAPPAPVYRD